MYILLCTENGFQAWTGGYVSCEDKRGVMACVAIGYPMISIQWWKGNDAMLGEVFPQYMSLNPPNTTVYCLEAQQ